MSLWAILPVKPFKSGKSRLASVLSEEERPLLNYALFDNTVKTLKAVPGVDQILVISRDPEALSLAGRYGARTVQEEDHSDLNRALVRATAVAQQEGADSILIIPVDLPLLTAGSVRQMTERASQPPVMVIAPDHHGEGTNGLLLNPPGLIPYRYGSHSFQQHVHLAQQKGFRVEIFRDQAFALDLDMPEDLALFRQIGILEKENRTSIKAVNENQK